MSVSSELTKALAEEWGIKDQELLVAIRVAMLSLAYSAVNSRKVAKEVLLELPAVITVLESMAGGEMGE